MPPELVVRLASGVVLPIAALRFVLPDELSIRVKAPSTVLLKLRVAVPASTVLLPVRLTESLKVIAPLAVVMFAPMLVLPPP